MSILFKILITLVLFVGILITIVGSTWVLSLQLNELLEVDVLWNIKKKVRAYIYGDNRKVVGRVFSRRTKRSKSDRAKIHSVKKRLFRAKDKPKAIQVQKNKTVKQVVKN